MIATFCRGCLSAVLLWWVFKETGHYSVTLFLFLVIVNSELAAFLAKETMYTTELHNETLEALVKGRQKK